MFTYRTPHGCPTFSAPTLVRYLSGHPTLLAILLISFGILSTFFGKAFFDITVGVLSGGLSGMLALLVMSTFEWLEYLQDPEDGELYMVIVSVIIALGIAFLIGWFMYKAGIKIGVMTIGVVAGFFLGMQLYNLLFF